MADDFHSVKEPFKPTGEKPYIFISYKHKDKKKVYPVIKRFHDAGFNIWYDAGLRKGRNYVINIAKHIEEADLFITFVTEEIIKFAYEEKDYPVRELGVAESESIPKLPIFLDDVKLCGFYSMFYTYSLSIYRRDCVDDEDFIEKCITTFKNDFHLEPNVTYSNPQEAELKIDDVAPIPEIPGQEDLSEAINSLSNVCQSSQDIVDRIADRIYGAYDDNARRYLADAYDMEIEHTYLDSNLLHEKYGASASSVAERMDNLKSEKSNMADEAINRIKGLNSIGYDIVGKDDERPEVTEFSDSEKIELAKYNHYVWCRDCLNNGEEYGFEGMGAGYMVPVVIGLQGSDIDIITPFRDSLLMWGDLSRYEHEENIEFIDRIFEYLDSDLKIVKLNVVKPKSYLKDMIQSGVKEIVLDSDIVFDTKDSQDIKIFNDDLIIDGDGHTIDACKKSRIFTIRGNNVTIKNLTFKNGFTDRNGGAVFVHQKGNCTFSNCHFINNTSSPGLFKVKAEGGAIYNEGSCILDSCIFKQNESDEVDSRSRDIAPFDSFELTNCTFDLDDEEELHKESEQPDSTDEQEVSLDVDEFDLPEPYEGDEPYIFVNYNHSDSKIVFPIIKRLADAGFNIWYDKDLNRGADYSIQIAKHIINSNLFVSFVTENMMSSSNDENDFSVKELSLAIGQEIPCLPIFLEEVALDGYYLMYYSSMHSIYKHEFGENEDLFIESCISILKDEFGLKSNDDNQCSEFEGFKTQNKLPPMAYDGNDPYIFVSYAHSDAGVVFPEIKRFISEGFNVWYDEGVGPEGEWLDHIEDRLSNSSLVVVFLSNNAVGSREIRNEIFMASRESIPILPIYIEETELKYGLGLTLAAVQSIYRYSMPEEKYVSQCLDAFKGFGLEPKAGQKQDKHNFEYLDSLIKNNSEIVLDSDISFDDVGYERGIEIKNDVVIDGAGHTIDAKGNARIFNISANNVIIKNINFENGFAESGGALIINQMAKTDVDSCNFKNNHAKEDGGAILNGGTVKISNSKFITNSSKNRGGAIKNWKDSVMEISTCEFNENNGLDGAAISNRGRLNISSTRFSQNEAVDSAGAVVNFKDCSISECDFSNNRSNGTTEVNGGGALFNYKGSLEVAYSKFEDNHSILGGGAIFNQDGQLLIDSSDFRKNASDGQGNSIANTEKASIMINKSQFDETQSNEIFSQGKMQLKGCKFKEEEKIKKPSKKDVFISYTTKDAKIANEVCNALESNGVACWIAPRDISTGPDYVEQILDGIKNASKFLVIYSKHYSESNFTKKELEMAFQLNKQLIPFNIDGSDIDGECRFFLSNIQWIDGRKDSDYSSLVNVLNGSPAPKVEPKKKGLRSRLFGR